MSSQPRIRGIVAAIATPVTPDLEPDVDALIAHARALLAGGCDGLNVLGTTGGFASFSVAQRTGVMRALAASGLPLEAMMVGTGAAALAETVELTQTARALGFGGVLVIPPFYYKGVSEDGVFGYVSTLVERADGGDGLRLYLYNFPAMSGVPYTVALVERLVAAYPRAIAGVKDSSNDAAYTAALHASCPELDVFPSSEGVLLDARRNGYAGCISATVNLTSARAAAVWRAADDESGARSQRELAEIRSAIASVPLIPAIHQLLAVRYGEAGWARMMPPLAALTPAERAALVTTLADTSYASELVR